MNGQGSQPHHDTLERDDVRQFDHEDSLGLQRLPNDGEEAEWVAGVLEDVDAKDNVVLFALELDLIEIHDTMLIGIRATSSLGLHDVDADHVDRSPDLKTLLPGFDVQDLEEVIAREDRIDESFRLRKIDINPL